MPTHLAKSARSAECSGDPRVRLRSIAEDYSLGVGSVTTSREASG